MKNKSIKLITIITLLFLFTGCYNTTQQPNTTIIKKDSKSTQQQQKVAKAFNDAPSLQKQHSKWFERKEKLPLTIIATAYIDPDIIKTKEYKEYKALIKNIQKDTSILGDIASKYSSIKFIDYHKSNHYKNKFNVAYTNRYNDKDILTDALRPDKEKPSQELLIRLNLEELKKGNLTIEGYKTVKQSKLKRNSYYYTLRKTNYTKLSDDEKNQAIINSLIATLQLSIPEYISIDRSKLVKDGEVLRFITPNKNGGYTGEVWKKTENKEITEIRNTVDNKLSLHKFKPLFVSKKQNHKVTAISISANGIHGISGHESGILKYWNLNKKKLIKSIKIKKTKNIYSLRILSNGTFALIGNSYGHLIYYDLIKEKEIFRMSIHTCITDIDLSTNEQYIVTGGCDGNIVYINLKKQKIIKTIIGEKKLIKKSKKQIQLEKNKIKKQYINDKSNALNVISANFSSISYNSNKEINSYRIESIDINNAGNKVLLGCSDGTIRYIDLLTSKLINKIQADKKSIYQIKFSNNEQFVFSGGSDGIIKYWNLKTGGLEKDFISHTSWISSFVISNQYMISSSGDKTLKYWSLRTGKLLNTLNTENEITEKVSLDKNGKYLLSSCKSNYIKLWNIRNDNIFKLLNQIDKIKQLSIYQENLNNQLLYTSSINKNDIIILKDYNYIKVVSHNTVNIKELKEIATSLNTISNSPFLLSSLGDLYHDYLNQNIEFIDKTIVIKSKRNYKIKNIYFSSFFNYKNNNYELISKIENINIDFRKEIIHEIDTSYITKESSYSNGRNIPKRDGFRSKKAYITKDNKYYAIPIYIDRHLPIFFNTKGNHFIDLQTGKFLVNLKYSNDNKDTSVKKNNTFPVGIKYLHNHDKYGTLFRISNDKSIAVNIIKTSEKDKKGITYYTYILVWNLPLEIMNAAY